MIETTHTISVWDRGPLSYDKRLTAFIPFAVADDSLTVKQCRYVYRIDDPRAYAMSLWCKTVESDHWEWLGLAG